MLRALLIATVGLALIAPAPAAQAVSRKDRKKAGEFYKTGKDHMIAKRYDKAAEAFEKAYELDPAPALLWNLARAHEESENFEEAKRRFQELVAAADTPDALRQRGLQQLRLVEAKLAEQRALERKKEAEAEQKRLAEQLKKELRKEIRTSLGDDEKKDGDKKVANVIVKPKEPPSEPDDSFMIAGWTTLGVGVLAGGAAVAMHFLAVGERDQVRDPAEQTESGLITSVTQKEARDIEKRANTYDTVAIAGAAAGGTLVLVGAVLLVLDATQPSAEGSGSVEVTAAPGRDGLTIGLSGRF